MRSVKGHNSHIQGLIRLIQWRGRADVTMKLLGQHIMELSRWNAVGNINMEHERA